MASLNSSSRFPQLSAKFCDTRYVSTGTGEAFNQACLNRIGPAARHDDGNRLRRVLGGLDYHGPPYQDDINLKTHQLSRKLREPISLALRISIFNIDVLSFYVAKIAQSPPNYLITVWTQREARAPIDTLYDRSFSAAAPRR